MKMASQLWFRMVTHFFWFSVVILKLLPSVNGSYFVINSLSSSGAEFLDIQDISQQTSYYANMGYTDMTSSIYSDYLSIRISKSDIDNFNVSYSEGSLPLLVNDVSNSAMYSLLAFPVEQPYFYSVPEPGEYYALQQVGSSNYSGESFVFLSESIFLGYGSAVFSGMEVILAADSDTQTVYSISPHNGSVSIVGSCAIRWIPSEVFVSQGIAETNTSGYSLVYGSVDGNIERQNLLDNSFSTVSDLSFDQSSSISFDPAYRRWYYYYHRFA